MNLINFRYSDGNWRTDQIQLNDQNLFVGKNAVGKSRTILSLAEVAAVIAQRTYLPKDKNVACYIVLEDDSDRILYHYIWENQCVTSEELILISSSGEKTNFIKRNQNDCVIDGESVNPPVDRLVLHVRRDTVKYPCIEKVINWAESVEGFSFNELDIDGDNNLFSRIWSKGTNLYSMVKTMESDSESLARVIVLASHLGYWLEAIMPVELSDIKKVVFKEKKVDNYLFDKTLSKGMFRTLYLLIYLEYIAHTGKPTLLLIDDLCEGLDYDRSTKLGKMIFEFCEENDIQLIATSNDSFLMDVVDLKYWNILYREGKTVSTKNIKNSPELFEDFSFTGLSNFDFFSSDYIKRHSAK